ncbi:MAG: MFS transporter [Dehalococcoidia bacterium]|nr:MFS transporter [Dehalococcoidia bacterium]
MAGVGRRPQASIRSLGLSVYLPTLLFAIGQGAVIPIVVLAAKDLGATAAVAGLIAAMRGIGVLSFDVPAGWLVGRFGEKRAMVAGTLIVAASLAGSALSPSPLVFGVFTLVMGWGWSVWLLARLTYVTDVMPIHQRGRALSALGGINRVGHFIGPLLFAVTEPWLDLDGAYYIHFATVLAATVLLWVLIRDGELGEVQHQSINLFGVVKEHRAVFLTAGVGTMAIQTLRASRQILLPLWADSVGLGAAEVGLIFSISLGMEMVLFMPAGAVMDRFGRKKVAIPCLALMAVGMAILPLTGAFWSISAVGLVMGLGNGLGSGINMTLGADFSPEVGRAQFLGAWRLCGDLGTAGGPLLLAGMTAALTLGGAAIVMGGIGAAGAVMILLRVPETLKRGEGGARAPGAGG